MSRLVPRKGFDALIARPRHAAHAGIPTSRSPSPARAATVDRLERAGRAARRRRSGSSGGCPTTTCRSLYGCADVFAMLCRNRWFGLEQEGFGIVFLEAAAAGVAQVAGASGGSDEAVVHGETGFVVQRPDGRVRGGSWSADAVRRCRPRRHELGAAARRPRRVEPSRTTCWPAGWPHGAESVR